MSSSYSLRSIQNLKPGEHLCFIFESEKEHQTLVSQFLRQGLERRERVLYVHDAHSSDEILAYLRNEGLKPDTYIASGQLRVRSAKEIFLKNGAFRPDDMMANLWNETQRALAEGYSALRVSFEMSWVQSNPPGSDRLFEFEGKINTFIPGSWCLALCQYDRRRFSSVELLEVITSHPTVAVGSEVYENFYYVPPGDAPGSDPLAATLRYRIENLAGRKRAEEALKERERKYRSIFENAVEGIFQTTPDGHYLNVNPALARIYGYASPEELAASVSDIGSQLYVVATRRQQFQRLMRENDVVQNFESEIYRKDGSVIWISENCRVVRDASGETLYYEGTVQNITERKRNSRRIVAQQAATRVLANASSLTEASRLILQAICESLEWELADIWSVDPTHNVLRSVEIWHAPGIEVKEFEEINRNTTFPMGIGLPGRVWATAEPLWILDVVKDSNFPRAPFAARVGLHGAFAFPIVLGDTVLGVFEFFSREIHEPDEDLLKMMATIGTQIGQFIERRRLEEELEKLRGELESRLAKEEAK